MAQMPAAKIPSLEEAKAILTAPGARYETERVLVDGRVVRSFKRIAPSLRRFWLNAVEWNRDNEYVVYEGERHTYGQVHEKAARLASVFRTMYHVRKGDRVAIAMRNCTEWIVAFWACHLLGAVSVAVNGWLPSTPFMHCLTHTSAKVILVDPERAKLLAPHIAQLKTGTAVLLCSATGSAKPAQSRNLNFQGIAHFDLVLKEYRGPKDSWLKETECVLDDNATIFFTSGTTGLPKGVLSTHRSFQHGYLSTAYNRDRMFLRFGLEIVKVPPQQGVVNKTVLLGAPLMHVTGTTSTLMSVTAMGFKLVLMRKWDPEAAAKLCIDEKINALIGVPSMVLDIAESSLPKQPNAMENIGFGGAPASTTLPDIGRAKFPNAVMGQGYGLTETNASVICVQGPDYNARPKSTGLLMPTCEMVVVDTKTGKIAPTGQVGELWIRGSSVMREYWKNKEETDKALTKDGWFKTGDLAYLDDEEFVYICDRGGENIHSINVENAIAADARVHEVSVVGIPHRRLGEVVGAVVVPKPEYFGAVKEQEIIARCKETLPHFAVPELVVIQREVIERNAAGKQVKVKVRKMLEKEYAVRQRKTKSKL